MLTTKSNGILLLLFYLRMNKKIIFLPLLLLFFAGCKKDKDSTPTLFIEPSDIVFDAKMGEIVTFKINANAPAGFNNLKVTYKETDTFTQTLKDSSLGGKTQFYWNYEFKIPAKSNAYSFDIGFVFTDQSGYEFSGARRVNVQVNNAALSEYTGNIFYSKNSGQADSYDLINRTALMSGSAAASLRNIQNDGTYDSGDSLARAWVSPAGNKFVRFNSYDYTNATYSSLVSTYESGIKLDTINHLQTGDLIFTKVTRNGVDTYQVLKLTSIIDQAGSANDLYIFAIKK